MMAIASGGLYRCGHRTLRFVTELLSKPIRYAT
jgi:hypothetical protein